MAQPSSRSTLIDYCKRQLGAPLLEINIADEQTEDLLDDAIQYFQERHFNGVIQTFLKYKVRQVDIDRARGRGGDLGVRRLVKYKGVGLNPRKRYRRYGKEIDY